MKLRGPRASRSTDYRQAIHEFSRSLTLIVDEDQLRSAIAAKLRDFFGLERVAVVLREGDGEPFRIVSARGLSREVTERASFAADGRLARWLKVNEAPLLLNENPGIASFIDDDDRATLETLGIAACFPLVAVNQLKGFLAVGPAGNGPDLGLNEEERELISLFAGQAALGFENAALIREQRARIKRLYQAERLATAGELAAGAAHEIRNPLTSIRSAIQHLRGDFADDSPRAVLIDDILAEVDRINGILEALLSFARPTEVKFEKVDLSELVRHTVALVAASARKGSVNLESNVPDTLPVEADANLIKQVVLNVMMNGLQAMPEGGTLTVSAEPAGRMVALSVRDTGSGIAPEDRDRIFDPFYTTKADGTGLGLSVCYGIVQRHGGDLMVESEPGVGTTLTIQLPARRR